MLPCIPVSKEMLERDRPVRIVVDSAADIPANLARELDITVVPQRLHMGGRTYLDGIDISGDVFTGNLLQVKPIMSVRPNGEAVVMERLRTRRKALERLVQLTSRSRTY